MQMSKVTGSASKIVLPGLRDLDRDTIEYGLTEHGFVDPPAVFSGSRIGWTIFSDPLEAEFDDINLWALDRYYLLGIRIDTKTVPPARFKALLDQRCKAWCAEYNRSRCPAAVRGEIKEQLEFEMLPQVLPKMKEIAAVFIPEQDLVLVHTFSQNDLDQIGKLLSETLGLIVCGWNPGLWLDAGHAFADDAGLVVISPTGSEFLEWLWFCSENGLGSIDMDGHHAEYWVGDKVVFKDDSCKTTLAGSTAASSMESRAALAQNRPIEQLEIVIRDDDREFSLTLTNEFATKGVKLPTVVSGGEEEFYDRIFLIEELDHLLQRLFRDFAYERAEAWEQAKEAIQQWRVPNG